MTTDIPVEVRITLLEQELQMWVRTRYMEQVRHRVHKSIGDEQEVAAIIVRLERCEKAIDQYTALLAELKGPDNGGKNGKPLLTDEEAQRSLHPGVSK